MAAGERDGESSDLESVSLSADIESGSIRQSSPDSDISSALHSREINSHSRASPVPSYVIVQRQMQDVLLTQKAMVEQLVRNNIEVLNESKTSFGKVVSSQEEKLRMLEENFVPKENLNALRENLEQECGRHRETEARLQEVLGKLDVALCQLAALTKQRDDDKLIFHSTCDSLREEILQLQASHGDIESRLAEKTWLCEEQKSQIAQQLAEIETLQKKQQTQTVKYKQMVLEANVEKQQEVYLNHLFSDNNKHNKKCL